MSLSRAELEDKLREIAVAINAFSIEWKRANNVFKQQSEVIKKELDILMQQTERCATEGDNLQTVAEGEELKRTMEDIKRKMQNKVGEKNDLDRRVKEYSENSSVEYQKLMQEYEHYQNTLQNLPKTNQNPPQPTPIPSPQQQETKSDRGHIIRAPKSTQDSQIDDASIKIELSEQVITSQVNFVQSISSSNKWLTDFCNKNEYTPSPTLEENPEKLSLISNKDPSFIINIKRNSVSAPTPPLL